MKEIKLKRSKEVTPRDKFIVVVKFSHGDADKDEFVNYVCDDEADFRRVVESLKNAPKSPSEGGDDDDYDKWELETFQSEDFIPNDVVFEGFKCSYDRYKAFYYDENGDKFEATID